MKILVINRGSSSLKCALYIFSSLPQTAQLPVWQGHLQWENALLDLQIKNQKGKVYQKRLSLLLEKEALHALFEHLYNGETAVLQDLNQVDVIGHRVVHGGKKFRESRRIDSELKKQIRLLADIAPLHNLINLEGIEAMEQLFIDKPQIAVFDTAFHRSLPEAAAIYPGPYKWYEEGIQRYGFHGISFQYCAKTAAALLNRNLNSLKMVICHLGAGASLCAVNEGKSVDTTMGFTPLEGLMMDTRSGSIDPGIVFYLAEKRKMPMEKMNEILNQDSGLLGISGISSDMRDIMEKKAEGNARAKLAIDLYVHRLNSCIGSMIASLEGIDALIFTAGIGENAPEIRERACAAFAFLGLKLDLGKNRAKMPVDREISSASSRVKVLLIHTQEAFEIARECWQILTEKK